MLHRRDSLPRPAVLLRRSALVLAASGWAGALLVLGFSLLLAPLLGGEWRWGWLQVAFGVAAVAAGQFVFLADVADRLFPTLRDTVGVRIELVCAMLFALAIVSCLVMLATGAGT
ncbi:MAG: hypothetical protein AAGI30_12115 [Planctomycetota bacterium]